MNTRRHIKKLLRKLQRKHLFRKLSRKIFLSHINSLLFLALLAGVATGFLSVLFRKMLKYGEHFVEKVISWLQTNVHDYSVAIVPVAGAIILVILMRIFPFVVGGYSMPNFLKAVHLKGGLIKTREIFAKMVTTTITISSGGSVGVEGPIAQIGGAAGSKIGRIFSMSTNRLKVLIACGSASAIAAQFNAPLAGVLFALEVIMLGNFGLESFGAIVIACGIATAISRSYYSDVALFDVVNYQLQFSDFLLVCVMGLLLGLLSCVFIRVFYATANFFQNLTIPTLSKPILGAAVVGILGLLHAGILGEGYDVIYSVLRFNHFTIGILILLVILKIIATSVTIGAGNVGGIFGPSLFIGAVFGALFGLVLNNFTDLQIQTWFFALVGMGAFLAATTHAPLTSIFLLFELTGDFEVIVPAMFASIIGTSVTKAIMKESIDTMQLTQEGIHLEDGREVNILKSIETSQVMHKDFISLQESDTLATLMQVMSKHKKHYYPIINNKDKLTGIVTFRIIQKIAVKEELKDLLVMKDIMSTNLTTLTSKDNLSDALHIFNIKDFEVLPVVDKKDKNKIIGMLYQRDIIDQYNNTLAVHDLHKE